jgi:hypothetical protein
VRTVFTGNFCCFLCLPTPKGEEPHLEALLKQHLCGGGGRLGSAPSTSFQEPPPSAMEVDDIVSLRPKPLWNGKPIHEDGEGDERPIKARKTDQSYRLFVGENYQEDMDGNPPPTPSLMRLQQWYFVNCVCPWRVTQCQVFAATRFGLFSTLFDSCSCGGKFWNIFGVRIGARASGDAPLHCQW